MDIWFAPKMIPDFKDFMMKIEEYDPTHIRSVRRIYPNRLDSVCSMIRKAESEIMEDVLR